MASSSLESPVPVRQFSHSLSAEQDWYRLGIHLGVPPNDLDDIEKYHGTEGTFKCLVKVHQYLSRISDSEETLCWQRICSVLRDMGNHALADRIFADYIAGTGSISPDPVSAQIPAPQLPPPIVIENDTVGNIAKQFQMLSDDFWRIKKEVKKVFKRKPKSAIIEVQDLIEDQYGLSRLPDEASSTVTHDAVFDKLAGQCSIINFHALVLLVQDILRSKRLMKSLIKFQHSVDKFKSSTYMVDLAALLKEVEPPEIVPDEYQVVKLKVQEFWSKFKMKQFERLVNEILQTLYSFVRCVSVTKGCICVSWIIPNSVDYAKLITKLPLDLVRAVGVISLQIGKDKIYCFEEEPSGCETIEAAMIQAIELKNTRALELLLAVGCNLQLATFGKNVGHVTSIVNIKEVEPSDCITSVTHMCTYGYERHVEAIVVQGCEPKCPSCELKGKLKNLLVQKNDQLQQQLAQLPISETRTNQMLHKEQDSLLMSLKRKESHLVKLRKLMQDCIPYTYLYKRFPTWREGNQTRMIPPIFNPRHQYSVPDSSYDELTDEDRSEFKIFNLLKQLGESNKISLFVFHGFNLRDITKWKKMYGERDIPCVPSVPDGECDFIIFHHSSSLGVVSMEIKTKVSNSVSSLNHQISKCEKKLSLSQDLVIKVSESNEKFPKFYSRVIALPTTRESFFADITEFSNLKSDTLLMFAEDIQDLMSFEKWWLRTIEASSTEASKFSRIQVNWDEPASKAYESALSYLVMIRHISGPITEGDCVKDIHQSLRSYRTCYSKPTQVIAKTKFPHLLRWLLEMSFDVDKLGKINVGDKAKELKKFIMIKNELKQEKDLISKQGMQIFNRILKDQRFITGETLHEADEMLALLFFQTYLVFSESIFAFFTNFQKRMLSVASHISTDNVEVNALQHEMYPFVKKLKSIAHLNKLGQHLNVSKFVTGDAPVEIDKYLFLSLLHNVQLEYGPAHYPMVMNMEQAVVFEGPEKQLIIGPPGSGKTELLKFKAKQLEDEIKKSKSQTRILFIVVGGSSDDPGFSHESLLFHQIRNFFSKNGSVVDVLSMPANDKHLSKLSTEYERIINPYKYSHVFISSYSPFDVQIGFSELFKGIEGCVWIATSSHNIPKIFAASQSHFLKSLERNGGVVNYIHHVTRSTNTIINFERDFYQSLYKFSHFPKLEMWEIYGHSPQGLPIQWEVEQSVDLMYSSCTGTVEKVLAVYNQPIIQTKMRVCINPSDILIIDFAVRIKDSITIEPLRDQLMRVGIPVFLLNKDDTPYHEANSVSLLSAMNSSASMYIDGIEWPMVIVILPSRFMQFTKVNDVEPLHSHDLIISLSSATTKLIVISDKWTNNEEFLIDVEFQSQNNPDFISHDQL